MRGNCLDKEMGEGHSRQKDNAAEVERCSKTVVWEYCVWGAGGRDRAVDRDRLGGASYGPGEKFKFCFESMREPLKEF